MTSLRIIQSFFELQEIKSNRVFGLDLMRFFAISLVLIAHSKFLFTSTNNFYFICGFWGVEIFFVLSGFLIGQILVIYLYDRQPSLKTTLNFWIRRWFRTAPNYFLFLTITVCLGIYFGWENQPTNWDLMQYYIFSQSLFNGHPTFFHVAWSLCIEEWFYLTCPIWIMAFRRYIGNLNNWYIISIITFLCLSLLFRIYVYDESLGFSSTRKTVFLRLDSIMYGVLFAYLFKKTDLFKKKWLNKLSLVGFVLTSLNIITLWYMVRLGILNSSFYMKTLYFSSVSLGITLLLPLFNQIKKPKPSILSSFVTTISLISYSIYLVHPLLIAEIKLRFIGNVPMQVTLYFTLTIFVSFFTFKFFEYPMTKLRNKFSKN